MKLLLDTHAFIWWISASEKLSTRIYDLLHEAESELFLSVASIWEIQIKLQLGKLTIKEPLDESIRKQQNENNMQVLPVLAAHAMMVGKLSMHHKDPFDQMLIAQAAVEDLTLVTHDSELNQYAIKTIW
jgi:PIN domain nuclease of toxin-antitoxin system